MQAKIKKLLRKIERHREIYWNIPKETGAFLNTLIRTLKYKNVLEIGTSNGYSGIWMAEALSYTNGKLYTIESHEKERFNLAKTNFRASGLGKYIEQIAGHAPEIIPSLPKYFDLIFLDATKYEYPAYLKTVRNRIKKEGMIIADNATTHSKELSPYVKLITKNKKFFTVKLLIGNGLFVSIAKPSV